MKYYSTPEEARDDFSALLDGELTPEDREALEGYVAGESGLLRELDALKRVDAAYRLLPRASAPARFEGRVRAGMRPRLVRLPRWRFRFGPRMVAVAATLLAVAIIGIGSGVMRAALNGRFDTAKVVGEKAPEVEVRMQAMPAQSEAAPAEEATATTVHAELVEGRSESFAASSALPERAATLDDADLSGAVAVGGLARAPQAAAPQTPPAASEVAQADRFDSNTPQSPPSVFGLEETDGERMNSADAAQSLRAANEEKSALETPAAAAAEFMDERVANELSRAKDASELKSESHRRVLAKSDADLPSPQVLAGRTFAVIADTWTEIGYDGEKTIALERNSDIARSLISRSEIIADLFARTERVIFQFNGAWYEIPAAAPR